MIIRRAFNVIDIGRDAGGGHAKELARCRDALVFGAAGKEPVVANAMDKEAPDELAGVERHRGVTRRTLNAIILDFFNPNRTLGCRGTPRRNSSFRLPRSGSLP